MVKDEKSLYVIRFWRVELNFDRRRFDQDTLSGHAEEMYISCISPVTSD